MVAAGGIITPAQLSGRTALPFPRAGRFGTGSICGNGLRKAEPPVGSVMHLPRSFGLSGQVLSENLRVARSALHGGTKSTKPWETIK